MSFPRYPAYKDSGVEWIKVVPTHWSILPMYSVVDECDEPNVGMKENNLLSLSYGHIVNKDINSNDGLLPESFETYQVVEPNDIVLRLTDLQNDQRSLRSAIVREKGIITSAYLAVRPRAITPSYLGYLLRAYDLTKVFYSMGGGLRQSMKFADLKRMPVLVPPAEEQVRIAGLLDRESTKIDTLVAEQEQLITLLKEKRQAVISHAVTKGLDPSVPMKDSGVEWLGEVPEHWGLRPLKAVATFRSGGTPDKRNAEYWDGEVPWVSAKDLKVDRLADSIDHITQLALDEGAASLVPEQAIVVVVRGMILARLFPVTQLVRPMAINQDLKALVPRTEVVADYLAWLLRASEPETLNCLDEAGHGTKALRMENWAGMVVPVPPTAEQRAIAAEIEVATRQLDQLVTEAVLSIELLRERRSALISAAVTGQIDVRGLAPAQEQAA